MSALALAYSGEPASGPEAPSKSANRVQELLDKVDYRLADSEEGWAAIGRLRYEAYLREGAIEPNASQSFTDAHDDDKNARTFGVYIDNELAASIRIHLLTKDAHDSPSFEAFFDVLEPELEAGKTIVDPNRFVINQQMARLYPNLPYAMLRVCWMASKYFNAEHTLAAVRPEHQAFYRRVFKHRPLCGARAYPPLIKPLTLMTTNYREITEYVYRRYPFFRSSYFERRPSAAVIPLTPFASEQLSPSDGQLQLFAQAG